METLEKYSENMSFDDSFGDYGVIDDEYCACSCHDLKEEVDMD